MTKEQLIEKYSQLYGEARSEDEETNRQFAYRQILTCLNGAEPMLDVLDHVQLILNVSQNWERRGIYQAFIKENQDASA